MAQQDAQEFMAFLLGKHININAVSITRCRRTARGCEPHCEEAVHRGPRLCRPARHSISPHPTLIISCRPDAVVADEAWANHGRRNESKVAALLQGQFRSRIVCPECQHDSVRFDAFNHITLPLPVKLKM